MGDERGGLVCRHGRGTGGRGRGCGRGWVHTVLLHCLVWLGVVVTAEDWTGPNKVPVVKFQEGAARSDTLLRYLGDMNDLTQVTVCFRVKVYQARDMISFVSYATSNNDNELFIAYIYRSRTLGIHCCESVLLLKEMALPLHELFSVCVSLDLRAGQWRQVHNGHLHEGHLSIAATTAPVVIHGGGTLILGQDQDVLKGGFNRLESLSGSLMDLEIYEDFLDARHMISYTLCESSNVSTTPEVHFSNIHRDFETHNVVIEETDPSSACRNASRFDIILPELRSFYESEDLCHTAGGSLVVPRNSEENRQLLQKTVAYSTAYLNITNSTRRAYWLGVRGDTFTQTWTYSNQPIGYHNLEGSSFSPILPATTCVAMLGDVTGVSGRYGQWLSASCDYKAKTVCQFDHTVTLRMRGLCRSSKFDRRYVMIENGLYPKFLGDMFSEITRHSGPVGDPKNPSDYGVWMIVRLDDPSIRAKLVMTSAVQYPLGVNSWLLENDECGSHMQLMMTSCREDQFSCTNGQCVDMGQRCDMEVDCSDASDEDQCSFVDQPKGYDSSKPPARQHGHTPTKIGLHVNILTIRDLDISNFKFVCEIVVTLAWFDDRLTYYHLNDWENLNVLDNISQVWTPTLEYLGHGRTSSEVTVRKVTLRIRRLSQPLPDDDQRLHEGEVFQGFDNLLVLQQKLTVTTVCRYTLEAFPFDTQTCSLDVVLAQVTSQYVALVPEDGGVTLKDGRRMIEYLLVAERMMTRNKGNYSGQRVEVTFRNLSTFYIFSTYLPTFTIVVIGYLVFFFPTDNFNERIMVGLTSLLVEATFFSQVNASIPGTAYMKLVDVWFVFCIVSLFLVVVTVVLVQWLQDRDAAVVVQVGFPVTTTSRVTRLDLSSRGVNRAAQVIFPVLTAAFLAVYVSLAVGHTRHNS